MSKPRMPAVRQMDNYSADVAQAFLNAEQAFFAAGKTYTKDNVISMLSNYGYFKIDFYENTAPTDIHYVIFFYNKITKEVFETHGTLAARYINLFRNQNITNFLIDNDRDAQIARKIIAIQSEGTLTWDSGTNQVSQQLYSTHIPAQEDQLIAYTENYKIVDALTVLINWKNHTLQKVGLRNIGRPNQILLHETAGMRMSESAVFKVPAHFCIGNSIHNKGVIYQMADIASNVPHGEITNSRAIGIEFVNAPFDIWKQIKDPNNPDKSIDQVPRVHSNFKLNESTEGIYLWIDKINMRDNPLNKNVQFIPLEFSDNTNNDFFEINIAEDKLLNKDALLAFKINNKNIAVLTAGVVTITYCNPLKFETLKALVENIEKNKLLTNYNLQDIQTWKSIYKNPADKKTYYFYDNLYSQTQTLTPIPKKSKTTKKITMHFPIDLTTPSIFSHGHIGHHSDGFLQGLYLYLRIYEKLPVKGVLQSMIYILTAAKTVGEKNPIQLNELMTVIRSSEIDNASKKESNISVQFNIPTSPILIKPPIFIELDKATIEKECPGIQTSL